jgi:hypothetical protein
MTSPYLESSLDPNLAGQFGQLSMQRICPGGTLAISAGSLRGGQHLAQQFMPFGQEGHLARAAKYAFCLQNLEHRAGRLRVLSDLLLSGPDDKALDGRIAMNAPQLVKLGQAQRATVALTGQIGRAVRAAGRYPGRAG